MLTQAQFDSLLQPVIYHHLELGQSMVPALRSNIFNVQSSSIAEEKGTSIGGLGTDAWDEYRKSGRKGRLDMDQLFTQNYEHVEYPVEIVIRKRLVINDQYNVIGNIVQRAGISAENKMERDAADIFNKAFSGKTWSDGKALCATTHPQSPNKSSGAFSNKGTSALTADAISTTRTAMMRFKDDKQEEIGIMPDTLIVPPELEDAAVKAVGSALDPDSANNAVNPQSGRFTIIPWLRLTDTNNWFMGASTWMLTANNWYNREAITSMLVHETTTELVYEVKLHYSWGTDDWRWIYGHEVSGS